MNKSITFLLSLFLGIIILSSFVSSSFKEGVIGCQGGVVWLKNRDHCVKDAKCKKCGTGLKCVGKSNIYGTCTSTN